MDGSPATTLTRPALRADELHPSVTDPQAGAMNFLNEIMSQYPDAVSFGPGAPYERFFDEVDVGAYVDRFAGHLRRHRGWDEPAVRRLLFQYGPSRGVINDLLADALRRDQGLDVRPADIVVTVGCQEALLLALRVLHRRDDVLAVVDPSYVGVTGAARLLDLAMAPIPDTGAGPSPDELRRLWHEVRAGGRRLRSLYVAPDYANPSGSRMPEEARRELLRVAAELDVLVLEDSAYGFTAAGEGLPSLKALDTTGRVLHLGTFAKVCVPGARVGYLVADQPVELPGGRTGTLAELVATAKSMTTVNTSPVSQALIGGMLLAHGGSLAELGRAKAARYRANLTTLIRALRTHLGAPDPGRVSWNEPDGGFFVTMRLPVPVDDALLHVSAAEYGVLWTPMRSFHLDGGGERDLRLSCSYLTDEQIGEGVRRLAAFLADPRCH
jgi:(S)-3,5-dihydroxyphenylglycine transaminase